jgi:ribosome-binding factor A
MTRALADIKRAQKESLLLRELSTYYLRITMDDSRLKDITLNRVKLSKDKSVCTLYFFTPKGLDEFSKMMPYLIVYKPSMRKALAQSINARYTPQLVFKYDDSFEKYLKMDALFESIKDTEQE